MKFLFLYIFMNFVFRDALLVGYISYQLVNVGFIKNKIRFVQYNHKLYRNTLH